MSIKIGDNNKIKKSNIIDNSNNTTKNEDISKQSFANKHPIIIGVVCSVIGSILMMCAFWDKVSIFIKNLI